MKFLLTMQICSLMSGECGQAMQRAMPLNSFHECIMAGHLNSMNVYQKLGPEFTNQDKTFIKFWCTESNTI